MLNPSGDWTPYLPLDKDVQVSTRKDMMACGSFSAVHIFETLTRFRTGQFLELSERALATLSGTTPQGNSLTNIVAAIKKYGFLLVSDWPELLYSDNLPDTTWEEYYQPIPQDISSKGLPVDVSLTKLSPSQVPAALQVAPVWTIITMGNTSHIVAQINEKQYYDSYEVRIKNFQPSQPIVSQYKLLLTPQFFMYVPKRVVRKDGVTFGVMLDSPNGCQIIYATGEDQWRSWNKPDSYQLPTVDSTGKTIWQVDVTLPW